ncbi:Ribosomal large subunit pseudouridine synthase D [Sedimentisphaera cyanobacteriorum]|uniref:Pseudouridine synthase n=1 Tax=Sedimentisphaera cyanobacteriorum TaxID=1940790 RepID=A0A1Q2HNM9_9BACT|nr:RluA family pseudouridine synthase [Sedimentisphaera cyanobacteriorum]AQQ09052.1 Ribosomal large subunit pseudouridine synthase D [Sedimentisphaera cyanobacteriorum]
MNTSEKHRNQTDIEDNQIWTPEGRFANATELQILLDNYQGGEQICLKVGPNLKFRRIDQYMSTRFNCFSRTLVQRLIRSGEILVNAEPVKISHRLNQDDIIQITLPPPVDQEVVPEDIPVDILYEDDDIIVVNKMPWMVVHPARCYKSGTLVNALAYHCKTLSSGSEKMRPGIVHRLDKNTTGCIIVAKNDDAQYNLAQQFKNRSTKKKYLAVVHGTPELDSDMIKNMIGPHPTVREKFAVRSEEGKKAITVYKVLERFNGYAYVEIDIHTGRTHQIRVHMSHLGYPIVADRIYGGKVVYPWQIKNELPSPQDILINRQALHAGWLEINHPRTGERMSFEAPLYQDMASLLDMLRTYR